VEEPHRLRTVVWIGSSRKDIKSFPDEVQDFIGYALYEAQMGRKASAAKPLSGFGGADVIEIFRDYKTDTYRAVYTVRFDDFIYVLHAFQKKSKRGIATAKSDIELIKARLKLAEAQHRVRQGDSRNR
jgi:phage-related protein